ncbi:MAG: hypothetical protein U0269_17430 [Polyangiales bacterium]
MLRRSPCSLAALALLALAQCGPRAARPDSGQRDASEDVLQVIEERPRPDRDGDGLCDDTETDVTRTDPDDVDTDGDGFIDGWEYSYGFSPLSSTAPSPDRLLQWSERPGEPFEHVFSLSFRGNGEGVLGTFWESPAGYDGLRAEELGLRIEALAAVPPSNAPDLVEDRFVSVLGTTRLSFRVTGEWPQRAPLRCKRTYSLYPSAYADGRGLIYLRTFFLVVSASDVEPSLDASAPSPDASDTDSAMPDAGPSGPWPFQQDGLCLPRPTWPCR